MRKLRGRGPTGTTTTTLLKGMCRWSGGRDGKSLGATPLTRNTQLFPVGRPVNYFIASPISSNDNRVSAAVRDWESKTCIRFNKCRSEGSCPRPYIRFSQGQGCSSPIGRRGNGVNSVSIARGCGVGATIHEIGHSLGLSHEQSRKDRDSFVRIDLSQVQRGMEFNFNKNSRTGRDMGKYDYGSIMHYGAYGFATGRQPVITAPAPIGQRNGLSAGDVAAIDFMYNGCSPTFSRPAVPGIGGGGDAHGAAVAHLHGRLQRGVRPRRSRCACRTAGRPPHRGCGT